MWNTILVAQVLFLCSDHDRQKHMEQSFIYFINYYLLKWEQAGGATYLIVSKKFKENRQDGRIAAIRSYPL